MPEKKPDTFEEKVARLEEIARKLETGNVELDAAVELFKEGKALSADCDAMLKKAQEDIDRAMGQVTQPEPDAEIPF